MAPLVRASLLACLVLGCGSDPAPAPGAGPENPGHVDMAEDVQSECTDFAQSLCASAQPCCEQGGAFDEDARA